MMAVGETVEYGVLGTVVGSVGGSSVLQLSNNLQSLLSTLLIYHWQS